MKKEEKIFFSILRSIVWGTQVELPTDVNWAEVLNLAANQKCLHAFGVWLKMHRISTPYDKQLLLSTYSVFSHQTRLNILTLNVVNLLTQHHIPAILIKGYGLSVLYPDPDTRDFGDVDIYVGEEDYLRAAELITAAYPDAYWHSDTRGGIHFILVLDKNLDRVVELHRVTMDFTDKRADTLYQNFTHKYLTKPAAIFIDMQSVSVPPLAYNTLYIFMHAWHHFESTGVGLRQLGDWALCLKLAHEQATPTERLALSNEIDQILTALHLKTAWQTFGHILVNELHLPIEAFPLYTTSYKHRANRLLRQLLRDGHGGRPALFQKNNSTQSFKNIIQEIVLMQRFPWERPKQNRVLQKCYTACRLVFEAWQMSKFFPSFAWHELKATIRSKYETDCTHKLHNNIALHVEHKGR